MCVALFGKGVGVGYLLIDGLLHMDDMQNGYYTNFLKDARFVYERTICRENMKFLGRIVYLTFQRVGLGMFGISGWNGMLTTMLATQTASTDDRCTTNVLR